MEGTGGYAHAHAHHCSLQSGFSYCTDQCAVDVDAEPSPSPSPPPPTSPARSPYLCEARGHDDARVDLPPPTLAEGIISDGDLSMSPSRCSSNSHIAPLTEYFEPHHSQQCSSGRCSLESPTSHSQQHHTSSLPLRSSPRTLDPNACEFTPLAVHSPMQPVYTAHSEITVSVGYQTNATSIQGPFQDGQLVDTSLRFWPPPAVVTFYNSEPISSHVQGVETGDNVKGSQFVPYMGLPEDYTCVNRGAAGEPYQEGSAGFLSVCNPPILANPHVGLLPPTAMPLPLPPPPVVTPCVPLVCPIRQPITHPRQLLTGYAHKHYHPHLGWKEHISRALLISGIPSHLTESQLRGQLEQWGHIRALHTDKLPQGVLSIQYFDLRVAWQALRDMQNQHLLRQQRFQEHLYAQSGMQFHKYRLHSVAAEQELGSRGLLGGHVVWAQYVAPWSVPVPDDHNQGTLVLFNVGADVSLQRLHQVFEKYGHVRELREAPTKRQHKFVDFYDTRDAEAAWTSLNGQDVCGKCVKIEFSRQGGPARKQKLVPALFHPDRVATGHDTSNKDSSFCVWQSHSSNAYYQHEWHAKISEGDPLPITRPHMVMLPNEFLGPDDYPIYAPSGATGWCANGEVNEGKYNINLQQVAAVAGPRKKHHIFRQHPKACHALVHGTENALAMRQTGAIERNASTRGHPHFEYDEEEVYMISGQPRTTLMIKNIPNKYSQQMLLSLLDNHCMEFNSQIRDLNEPESAYDFVYLPIDFKNRCNLGYAFVNFTSALATLKLFKAFHAQPWGEFNSRKICDIKYARVQGRRALENHFCNSRFACEAIEYLPVVFTPPRNGLGCTPPPRAAAGLMIIKSGRQGGRGSGSALMQGACPTTVLQLLRPAISLPEGDSPHEKSPPDSGADTVQAHEAEHLDGEEILLIPEQDT